MKRILYSSLRNSSTSKEQIINSNSSLKKQKLMAVETSTPLLQYTPRNSENNDETSSDILTLDTPRSDDTNTLLSDTSGSDTVTDDDDVLDTEIAIRNQFVNGREQGKTKETGNKIFNGQARLIEKGKVNPIKLVVNELDKKYEKGEIVDNKMVKSKDKGKNVEVEKDKSKLLQGIMVDTEDKSLSIFLDTSEINCHSLTVKSKVQMIKISPKLAICPISFKPKKVRMIINYQGRLINQHNHSEFNSPCSILLRNGLNYVEIWVYELKMNVDDHDDVIQGLGQKYLLFITKL
ncbi:hypothetical protein C1645_834463 [Glomus cerebriforme]|uniref:Uncharacterized protein n=1 Tax=Glomus cerebriforme TaxID=658196 RepID=A0A397SKB0_9GLOM|nr:hypothetical protein C1645_834463 [Glomus cerebriforme]